MGLKSDDVEIVELSKQLQILNKEIKNIDLPAMRKYAAIIMSELVNYEQNFTVSGNRNTIITITSSKYIMPNNIENAQKELYMVFKNLRFKQARYRWSAEYSEYTYYDLNTTPDDEPFYPE